MATGLFLQAVSLAWMALVTSPQMPPTPTIVPAFVVSGVGMALFFVPVASLVLASVRPADEGIASGTNNAVRELGGVLGVSVLGAVFSARGGYSSASAYVAGLVPAVWVGVAVVGVGAVVALLLPRRIGARATASLEAPSLEAPSLEAPSLEAPSLEAPSLESPSLESPTGVRDDPAAPVPAMSGPVAVAGRP